MSKSDFDKMLDKVNQTPEEMLERIDTLEKTLEYEGQEHHEFINKVWEIGFPNEKPDDWDYPGQVLRMLGDELTRLRTRDANFDAAMSKVEQENEHLKEQNKAYSAVLHKIAVNLNIPVDSCISAGGHELYPDTGGLTCRHCGYRQAINQQ